MATRLKGNKGYYSLLFTDSAWGTALIAITLGLVSPPIAAITMAINFGVDIAAGIINGPKKPHIVVRSGEDAAPGPKPGPLKRAKNFSKKWYNYIKAGFKDPDYVVGAASAGAGLNIFFQALLGISSILSTHSILFLKGITGAALTASIGGCAAVAAIGLFCIVAGKLDKWKGTHRFYSAVFKGGAPKEEPHQSLGQKLSRRPLIQKVLNSRLSKGIKKYLMIAMTAESSFFTVVASSSVIALNGAAIISNPRKITTAAVPLFLAVRWGAGAIWHVISAGKILVRDRLKKLRRKHAIAKTDDPPLAPDPKLVFDPAPEATPAPGAVLAAQAVPDPIPASVAANENKAAESLTATFGEAAEKDQTLDPAQVKSRMRAESRTRTIKPKP